VCSQYRVDCPPGYETGKAFIVPDLVLLVNGIPLAVVECKSPTVPEPLSQAVDQLRRYHNQRYRDNEVVDNEGNEPLCATNQLLIATSFDEARVGTIGAGFNHYAPWKTVAPETEHDVAARLGVETLSEQQRLIAGMLTPERLFDIVRHFVLFMNAGGQMVKAVCRYQQFRAVQRTIASLKDGKTRLQDGEIDRRGGIIWHTQGSGKSLTMVFLVRKLRTNPGLRRFKVVVITDRTDLQRQLSGTAELTGDVVEVAESAVAFQKMVKRQGPGLVFATIQKNRNADTADEPGLKAEDLPEAKQVSEPSPKYFVNSSGAALPDILNEDEDILVLVDEAHRTQAGDLQANLLAGLPNCARIGFTGTPIIGTKQ
jgi:type I restriction enzyme R subunit